MTQSKHEQQITLVNLGNEILLILSKALKGYDHGEAISLGMSAVVGVLHKIVDKHIDEPEKTQCLKGIALIRNQAKG